MRRPFVILAAIIVPIVIGPGWTGDSRLPLLGKAVRMTATPVALDPADPARRRIGALTFMGGVALDSTDPAFGGFSALAVDGDLFTLLSDGGNIVRFRMGGDWRPRGVSFAELPGGPRTGWSKRDRDSESMTRDPRTGRIWVGFESANEIWRYSAGFARVERGVAPAAMAAWEGNGGIESMTRLADGRFVALSESREPGGAKGMRTGLVWAGDPTRRPAPAFRFAYRPTPGYDPADIAELPDGRLLVLERSFGLPFDWYNRLMLVERSALRPGGVAGGRLIARFAAPLIHDNFEGVTVTRERDATIVWLVSDNNQLAIQRSLLLKFRFEG